MMLSFPFSDEKSCDANFFHLFINLVKKDLGEIFVDNIYRYVNRYFSTKV